MQTKHLAFAKIHSILFILFFISGCAALIYQVMWQRILFTFFGIDLESMTIIISVFMFGLGIGGILGGIISDFLSSKLIGLYILIELSITVFGFFSPTLLNSLINHIIYFNEWITAGISFAILAIPTIAMGATFPILVRYITLFEPSIGSSVGELYFANTLGGMLGAYSAGFILLYHFTIPESIYCAASLNLIIVILAMGLLWRKA